MVKFCYNFIDKYFYGAGNNKIVENNNNINKISIGLYFFSR